MPGWVDFFGNRGSLSRVRNPQTELSFVKRGGKKSQPSGTVVVTVTDHTAERKTAVVHAGGNGPGNVRLIQPLQPSSNSLLALGCRRVFIVSSRTKMMAAVVREVNLRVS